MAGAIVDGLLKKGGMEPTAIACTCGADYTGAHLAAKTGIAYVESGVEMVRSSDTLILACKPQQFSDLSEEAGEAARGLLLISILAGTRIKTLRGRFGGCRAIVRTMPNTPAQVGAGVTGWSLETEAAALSDFDSARLQLILGALGKSIQLPEALLDAVTALSGSGPAYLFELTAALEEAGRVAGLDEDAARLLARETVIGSARLLEEDPASPEELRVRVTSPGGTTEAALGVLEQKGFRSMLTAAVLRARDRSKELSEL